MKIAIYTQQDYAKKTYKKDNFTARMFPGVMMVKDVLLRNGYEVGYVDMNNVADCDIILVSIISAIDWYTFILERIKWPKGNYTVIVGGEGSQNVRPFLDYVDIFVFGRGENLILPLIQAIEAKKKLNHPSVCYSKDFSIDNKYQIMQSDSAYPFEIELANGKRWQEKSFGCQLKCLFCNYSWTRNRVTGDLQSQTGIGSKLWPSSTEMTMLELDLNNPYTWTEANKSRLTFGLDGSSQRLRYLLGKPITDKTFTQLLNGLLHFDHLHKVRLYNIVGLPSESQDDFMQLKTILYSIDEHLSKEENYRGFDPGYRVKIEIHNTPFKPTPATPAAVWPVSTVNWRDGRLVEWMQHPLDSEAGYKQIIYNGKRTSFQIGPFIESFPTVVEWMLGLRGVEQDKEAMKYLAMNKKYQNSNTEEKTKRLSDLVDLNRILGWYTWDKLPTRYLESYVSLADMAKVSDIRLRKYGGEYGKELADNIKGES